MSQGEDEGPFYGKFRGLVVDGQDPRQIGRVRVEVRGLNVTAWALPCVPWAGSRVGVVGDSAPPVGTNVWVEFERGDPEYPIWAGVFLDDA